MGNSLIYSIFVLFLYSSCNSVYSQEVSITSFNLTSTSTVVKGSWEIQGDENSINNIVIVFIEDTFETEVVVPAYERSIIYDNLLPSTKYDMCVCLDDDEASCDNPHCQHTNTSASDPVLKSIDVTPKDVSLQVNWEIEGPIDRVKLVYLNWTNFHMQVDASSTTMEITNLEPDTEYEICVDLINVVDLSSGSKCVTVQTTGGGGGTGDCPAAYELIGSRCFHVDTVENWIQSRAACEMMALEEGFAGDLAIIKDEVDFISISNYMREKGYHEFWLGGFDLGHEGTWKWIDGSSFDLFSSYWQCGSPNLDQLSNCAVLTEVPDTAAGEPITRIKIVDSPCENVHRALCELKVFKKRALK